MIEAFDSKYARIHAEIQENADLVRRIYDTALVEGLKNEQPFYFPCGRVGDIPIGLDLKFSRSCFCFPEVVAKMRMLYDSSDGELDLSRVYARMADPKGSLEGCGIVSEDMSCGGAFRVWGDSMGGKHWDFLGEFFINDPSDSFPAAAFTVIKEGAGMVRTPVVDLDHLEVKPKHQSIYEKYCGQYETDERFMIHLV